MAACGALQGLAACLEEFDPGVKEEAAWTLGYVACHTPALAQQARPAPPCAPHAAAGAHGPASRAPKTSKRGVLHAAVLIVTQRDSRDSSASQT